MYLAQTMTESLDQILELIKKTGDRCVVIDRATQNNYVVMSIKDYEHLALGRQQKPPAEPVPLAPIKEEEVVQSTLPLGGMPLLGLAETTAPDWWQEEAERPRVLDHNSEEKPVEDHYYLEPVDS